MNTTKALEIASISRSAYHYKSNGRRKGKRPTGFTEYRGRMVSDRQVIRSINNILQEDFIDYGYSRTTKALKALGYLINRKKVYRIMKEPNAQSINLSAYPCKYPFAAKHMLFYPTYTI